MSGDNGSSPSYHTVTPLQTNGAPRLKTPIATPTSAEQRPVAYSGLYFRQKRSASRDLEGARRALSLSPASLSPSSIGSSPSSPNRRRKNAKRLIQLLWFLLAFSMCATVTFTVYLIQHLSDEPGIQHTIMGNKRNGVSPNAQLTMVKAPDRKEEDNTDKQNEDNAVLTPMNNKKTSMPRMFYLEINSGYDGTFVSRRLEDDLTLHAPPGEAAAAQDEFDPNKYWDPDCVPMSKWQTASYPNCNTLHEMEMQAAGPHVGVHRKVGYTDSMHLLGQGWFRHTWQVDVGATNETVVLKTLRLEREFYSEFFELHRRDAVAMERLTFSPFVMDIYGFCGQSVINEMASFGHGDITNLEKFDRRLRGKDSPQALFVKLQIATSVAVGVAHVHQINGVDARPSMVHYDLNPRNIAIVKGGKPKLNDFNIAEFLRVNARNQTCGFPSRLHEPWWRAPEEVIIPEPGEMRIVDEKVDVFSLGNLLYHVLTTHSPRGKMNKRQRMELVRHDVSEGQQPPLHQFYIQNKDPAVKAFKKAMKMCFKKNPKERASASEVANVLLDALMDIREKNPNIGKAKHHHDH